MKTHFSSKALRMSVALLSLLGAAAFAAPDNAASLRDKYTELTPQLQQNQFKRPLVLDSTEESKNVKGDIYAVLDYPFAAVSKNLDSAKEWCDVLILHLNTKYCSASSSGAEATMVVYIGKKSDEPLESAYRTQFRYAVSARTDDYMELTMNAAKGPMGTNDYRIVVQAVALPDKKTFLHLSYAYGYNFTGKLALQAYLATVGAGKVGFSRSGGDYIDGMRGLVERNTMRYYLAIDAYLAAAPLSPAAQFEKRLDTWFNAVEEYPRQLHELDRTAYMTMKRHEYERQQLPE